MPENRVESQSHSTFMNGFCARSNSRAALSIGSSDGGNPPDPDPVDPDPVDPDPTAVGTFASFGPGCLTKGRIHEVACSGGSLNVPSGPHFNVVVMTDREPDVSNM